MWNADSAGPWSAANFALLEASLWQEDQRQPIDLSWLALSWKDPINFWQALHAYSERRQASQSKSVPCSRYDFYYDLLVRHKD